MYPPGPCKVTMESIPDPGFKQLTPRLRIRKVIAVCSAILVKKANVNSCSVPYKYPRTGIKLIKAVASGKSLDKNSRVLIFESINSKEIPMNKKQTLVLKASLPGKMVASFAGISLKRSSSIPEFQLKIYSAWVIMLITMTMITKS